MRDSRTWRARAWASTAALAGMFFAVTPVHAEPSWADPRLESQTSPELRTFQSEREYRRWVRDRRAISRAIYREERGLSAAPAQDAIVVAQADFECQPEFEDCGGDGIVVTGSRVVSAPQFTPLATTSITNNQVAAVDEGDIVKRIGDYLLVLQDGRIFAANFRTMALTDRIDVYRRDSDGEPIGADWYDEMLVQGDTILVTAYSYSDEATELSVFRLDRATGRIERRGVFLISSEDYYDADNYATRVVGDQLVIYSQYDPEDLVDRRQRPVVRRWTPQDEFAEREPRGEPLIAVTNIHLPVFPVREPVVHMVSVCQLGQLSSDRLPCASTGYIAAAGAEMFVSSDNAYLATTASSYRDVYDRQACRGQADGTVATTAIPPGAVFRTPLYRGNPDLLAVRGTVVDQFSMDQQATRFHMLTQWPGYVCRNERWDDAAPAAPELIDEAIGSFATRYRTAPDSRFARLPVAGAGHMENRFIGEWLLYGTRTRYGRPPLRDDDETAEPAAAVAVPLANPQGATLLALGHEITRLESLGRDAIATGYRDDSGLNLTYIDLGETAQVASQTFLANRYESESRSHAFNAIGYPDGGGYMGLPTVLGEEDAGRYPWRSSNSQVSFFSYDAAGGVADIGQVSPAEKSGEGDGEALDCEVSCTDWYGNARPIFIDRMAYALLGTELVELRPSADRIDVLRRLALATARD